MIPMIMLLLSIMSAVGADDAGAPYPNELSPLQKHVAFFDRNHDGLVYPWETFEGFRAIGAGSFLSTAGALFINAALSGVTTGKSPFPFYAIEVKKIHLAKHGSDSDVYDSQGRFVPSKFEEIFSKFAHTYADALTSDELSAMLKANREPNDSKGRVASWTEWKALYNLFKDSDGLLRKETIRAVYDGSLFVEKEKEVAAAKKKA